MASQDDGSVTRWIGDLKAGGDSAAQHLWERYFHRLVHLARARLRAARRVGAVEDEEDAALSAFDSFCRGAAAGLEVADPAGDRAFVLGCHGMPSAVSKCTPPSRPILIRPRRALEGVRTPRIFPPGPGPPPVPFLIYP